MADVMWGVNLDIQRGLGLPDNLLRADAARAEAGSMHPNVLDASSAPHRAASLAMLLQDHNYELFSMLGADDFNVLADEAEGAIHSIAFTYAVEPPGRQLMRGSMLSHTSLYEALRVHTKATQVNTSDRGRCSNIDSHGAMMDKLVGHASGGLHASISLGCSREYLFGQETHVGVELTTVFVRMWLTHLSVLAGHSVRVRVDLAQLGGPFAGEKTKYHSDMARSLSGVRVNGRGMSDETLALFALACSDMQSYPDLHVRAARYRFAPDPLSVYGAGGRKPFRVSLDDATVTGHAIVLLAERYGQLDSCGEALRTALLLFGIADSGRKITLLCKRALLHDDIATGGNETKAISMRSNSDLADRRLLSLSLYQGRYYTQASGHQLRACLDAMSGVDMDGGGKALLSEQPAVLHDVGIRHYELMSGLTRTLAGDDFILDNYARLYDQRGVAHCLAMGLVVAGSVLEEAVKAFVVPHATTSRPSDNPAAPAVKQKELADLTLAIDLMSTGGDNLSGSGKARVKRISGALPVPMAQVQLGGTTIQFTILAVGGNVNVALNTDSLSVAPVRTLAASSDMVGPQESVAMQQSERPKGSANLDFMLGGLGHYQPVRSAVQRSTVSGDVAPLAITDSGPLAGVVAAVVDKSMSVLETSGEGLLCGARAIKTSLASQYNVHVTEDDVVRAVTGAMTDEIKATAAVAGVPLLEQDFTGQQLELGLRALGEYSLVVVHEARPGEPAVALRVGADDRPPLVIHNHAGHWSAMGRGKGRMVTLAKSGRPV